MTTGISWTDVTWNPTTGCDRVSDGCDRCYAMTMAKRLKGMGSAKYQRDGDPKTSGPGFGLTVHPGALAAPLRRRKPTTFFVNSMSDLFHADVPDDFIAQVFGVMAATPRHTYQVLTKRHARLRSLLNNYGWWTSVVLHAMDYEEAPGGERRGPTQTQPDGCALLNVHLGVSAEDQHWADIRIPALMHTPAAVRFVSAEPLLGPIRLHRGLVYCPTHDFTGGFCKGPCPDLIVPDWLIIGGESGAGARPMDITWARDLLNSCQTAGIAPFVKQLGAVIGRELGAGPHGADWDNWPEDLKIRQFPLAAEVAAS
jgi:protein gp37